MNPIAQAISDLIMQDLQRQSDAENSELYFNDYEQDGSRVRVDGVFDAQKMGLQLATQLGLIK